MWPKLAPTSRHMVPWIGCLSHHPPLFFLSFFLPLSLLLFFQSVVTLYHCSLNKSRCSSEGKVSCMGNTVSSPPLFFSSSFPSLSFLSSPLFFFFSLLFSLFPFLFLFLNGASQLPITELAADCRDETNVEDA